MPGRKNERRIKARNRLNEQYANVKASNNHSQVDRLVSAIDKLNKKIVAPEIARSTRTKKDRSHTAKIRE